jgi:hypothetical protein
MFAFTVTYLVSIHSHPDLGTKWGALAVLFAWIELTLLIGRFPAIGMYVYMSVHVTKMLIKLFCFFATILGSKTSNKEI